MKKPIGSTAPIAVLLAPTCTLCVNVLRLKVCVWCVAIFVCVLVSGDYDPALTSYVVKNKSWTPRAPGVLIPMRLLTPQVFKRSHIILIFYFWSAYTCPVWHHKGTNCVFQLTPSLKIGQAKDGHFWLLGSSGTEPSHIVTVVKWISQDTRPQTFCHSQTLFFIVFQWGFCFLNIFLILVHIYYLYSLF